MEIKVVLQNEVVQIIGSNGAGLDFAAGSIRTSKAFAPHSELVYQKILSDQDALDLLKAFRETAKNFLLERGIDYVQPE